MTLQRAGRFVILAIITAAQLSFPGSIAAAPHFQKPSLFNMKLNVLEKLVTWDAQNIGQAAFDITGTVRYGPDISSRNPSTQFETVDFKQTLPASATSYHLPTAKDPTLTQPLSINVSLTAVDGNGRTLQFDGIAFQLGPAGIPQEAPSTGVGLLLSSDSISRIFLITLLSAAGGLLLLGCKIGFAKPR